MTPSAESRHSNLTASPHFPLGVSSVTKTRQGPVVSVNFQLPPDTMLGVSRESQEELAYLNEVLKVLMDSLAREQQTEKREHLQEYIRDIQSRIAALGYRPNPSG